MSYVDDVYSRVVEQNPSQPEFHQAVKEVLESLRPVIESDEEKYRKEALLERLIIQFFSLRKFLIFIWLIFMVFPIYTEIHSLEFNQNITLFY